MYGASAVEVLSDYRSRCSVSQAGNDHKTFQCLKREGISTRGLFERDSCAIKLSRNTALNDFSFCCGIPPACHSSGSSEVPGVKRSFHR